MPELLQEWQFSLSVHCGAIYSLITDDWRHAVNSKTEGLSPLSVATEISQNGVFYKNVMPVLVRLVLEFRERMFPIPKTGTFS